MLNSLGSSKQKGALSMWTFHGKHMVISLQHAQHQGLGTAPGFLLWRCPSLSGVVLPFMELRSTHQLLTHPWSLCSLGFTSHPSVWQHLSSHPCISLFFLHDQCVTRFIYDRLVRFYPDIILRQDRKTGEILGTWEARDPWLRNLVDVSADKAARPHHCGQLPADGVFFLASYFLERSPDTLFMKN